jgi:hypothetical protein
MISSSFQILLQHMQATEDHTKDTVMFMDAELVHALVSQLLIKFGFSNSSVQCTHLTGQSFLKK